MFCHMVYVYVLAIIARWLINLMDLSSSNQEQGILEEYQINRRKMDGKWTRIIDALQWSIWSYHLAWIMPNRPAQLEWRVWSRPKSIMCPFHPLIPLSRCNYFGRLHKVRTVSTRKSNILRSPKQQNDGGKILGFVRNVFLIIRSPINIVLPNRYGPKTSSISYRSYHTSWETA